MHYENASLIAAISEGGSKDETPGCTQPNKEEDSQSDAAIDAKTTLMPCGALVSERNPEKIAKTGQIDLDISSVGCGRPSFLKPERKQNRKCASVVSFPEETSEGDFIQVIFKAQRKKAKKD